MDTISRPRRGSKLAAQRERSFSDKFWHDKNGNFVVFQPLNAWIVTWFVASVFSQFLRSHPWQDIFSWISFGALIIWAVLEVRSGVNYFRRILGGTILLLSIFVRF